METSLNLACVLLLYRLPEFGPFVAAKAVHLLKNTVRRGDMPQSWCELAIIQIENAHLSQRAPGRNQSGY